jgi:hypothetical protein
MGAKIITDLCRAMKHNTDADKKDEIAYLNKSNEK